MKKYLEKSCVLTAALVAIFLTAPVAAAPNGMVVNAGTGSVTVFDDATGVVQGSLLIGSGSMGDCSITGDGSTGFATRFNNQVTVIDLTGGAPVLAGPPNPIPISNFGEDTSISPDGQFLVVCDGGNVQPVSVVDIATQTEISTFALGTDCNSVDVCSDGSVIVTSSNAQNVRRLTIDGAGNLADTGDVLFPGGAPNNAVCGPGATSGVVITRGGGGIARSFTIPGLAPVSAVGVGGFGISMVIDSAGSTLFTRANSVVNAYNYSDATGTIGAPLWGPIAIAATPTFFGMDQMALNPANNRLYVSQPGSLDIYNPATGGFIASILDPNIQTATGICFPSTNVIEVDIDIKFCSNPNGYNCKSRGVTPVTIFGTEDFDATDIIVSTLQLCLTDLSDCTDSEPKDSSQADRGDPTTDIGAAQCTVIDGVEQDFLNPDGETDLDVAFHTQDVVNLIGCDTLSKGDASPTLVLIGETNDGSLITSVPIGDVGVDQLLIQKN